MNVLLSVSGSGVTIGEVNGGQVGCAKFASENAERLTLRHAIRKYWGLGNTVVVEDCEFGTGYHRVTTHCGAGGVGWGYRLHQVVSVDESVAMHDAMVRQALAKEPVTGKSGLEVAFERVSDLEDRILKGCA